ncbi:MAG TPA: hypothetical protein VF096_13440 [Azonexus sp.]
MSPLSRERLLVGLAPERLGAVRLGFWRRRQHLGEQALALAPPAAGAPWASGIETLELLLDDPAWRSRTLSVALSSHYVRYAVLPRGRHLALPEQTELAQVVFRKLFGELASDWECRISPGDGETTVASAVPTALLDALRAACQGRVTLHSVQPGLMSIFNRVRAGIGRHDGTLAVVEAGRITLAALAAGAWQTVTSRAWEPEALPALLAELGELSARPAGGRLWLCDLSGRAAAPAAPAWQVERLFAGQRAGLLSWGLA